MKPVLACPNCGHEVTTKGSMGQTIPGLAATWADIARPQLGALKADIETLPSVAAVHLEVDGRALVAEIAPSAGADADMAMVALDVARLVAPSWPAFLGPAGALFVAHVGSHTFTAGATLMESLAHDLVDDLWLANVLVETL